MCSVSRGNQFHRVCNGDVEGRVAAWYLSLHLGFLTSSVVGRDEGVGLMWVPSFLCSFM